MISENVMDGADIDTCKVSAQLDTWLPQKGPVKNELD